MPTISIELTDKQFSVFSEATKYSGFESLEEYLENAAMAQIVDFRRNQQYQKTAKMLDQQPLLNNSGFDFTELTKAVKTIAQSFVVTEHVVSYSEPEVPKDRTASHL